MKVFHTWHISYIEVILGKIFVQFSFRRLYISWVLTLYKIVNVRLSEHLICQVSLLWTCHTSLFSIQTSFYLDINFAQLLLNSILDQKLQLNQNTNTFFMDFGIKNVEIEEYIIFKSGDFLQLRVCPPSVMDSYHCLFRQL